MSSEAYKKLLEKRLPTPIITSENMPVFWISPQVLDQNLTLTYELDWKTPNMPIKDPRNKILKKKP